MARRPSVLIFEYITSGGVEEQEDFKSLISEGYGMLSALIRDFARIGYEIRTLVDYRIFERFSSEHNDLIEQNQITIAKINSPNQINMILENIIPNNSYILIIYKRYIAFCSMVGQENLLSIFSCLPHILLLDQ